VTLRLEGFQEAIVARVAALVAGAAAAGDGPGGRAQAARDLGLLALAAPTGSGKTLMTAAALERVSRAGDFVWFWFAPFAALIDQTRMAMLEHHGGLVPRLLAEDRDLQSTAPGHVFLATWGTVAVNNTAGRRARTPRERMPSVDELVRALRAGGRRIGLVVDEAHYAFRAGGQSGRFVREVLRPDAAILVTATPDEAEMRRVAGGVGHRTAPRVFSVSRDDVVAARLNKARLHAVSLHVRPQDRAFVDPEEAAIFAAVRRHGEVKADLARLGVRMTPLLLVQAGDDAAVRRAQEHLRRHGVPADRVAVHTASEPDPDVIAVARGEDKEALVFKVAVALGFDAPRAFTLAALRPVVDPDFALQIVGRLMRVDRRLRGIPTEGDDERAAAARRLDEAHIYLAEPAGQVGLDLAAARLKALRTSLAPVSMQFSLVDLEVGRDGVEVAATADADPEAEPAYEREPFADDPVAAGGGVPAGAIAGAPAAPAMPLLFPVGSIAERAGRAAARRPPPPDAHVYRLKPELGVPERFLRERLPDDVDGLLEAIAARMAFGPEQLAVFRRETVQAGAHRREIFTDETMRETIALPLSRARVGLAGQRALCFNQHLDPRDLAAVLLRRLRARLEEEGWPEQAEDDLVRGLNVILARMPDALRRAQREALGRGVLLEPAAVLPDRIVSPKPLDPSPRNVYGVMPPDMNGWERAFAEWLDAEDVRWWHRNQPRRPESVSILVESGQHYYPDFVVGVDGRERFDGVRLAETKRVFDDAEGRLKLRSEHGRYGTAIMLVMDARTQEFFLVEEPVPGRPQPGRRLDGALLATW
jgi:superfamily II DNA or RNA helicase